MRSLKKIICMALSVVMASTFSVSVIAKTNSNIIQSVVNKANQEGELEKNNNMYSASLSSNKNAELDYEKINGINQNTVLGLDFTHYQQNLEWGKTYYNYKQEKIDNLFEFVKKQGVTTISVKVAVNPSEEEKCYSLDHAKKTLKEAEEAGLQTNVILLYSDTMTYANQQTLPASWSQETAEAQALAYTDDTLNELKSVGVIPDIVTVGNEINYNFLNFTDSEDGNNEWLGWQAMSKITDDIESFDESIKVMISIAEPSTGEDIEWILAKLNDDWSPVRYDYVGVNLYPTDKTNQNIEVMRETFERVETEAKKEAQLLVSNVKYQGRTKGENAERISMVDDQTEKIYDLLNATISDSNAGGLIYDYADMVGDYNSFFDEYGIAATSLAIFAYAQGDKVDVTVEREPFQFGVEPNLKQQTVHIDKISNMSQSTVNGVDVSSYVALQNAGVKFYDYNGEESPLMQILKENGVNYIRIRLWIDPKDENGNTYGGGNNDTETGIKIATDATRYGMKVMLNFQYSDFWTDPSQQVLPKSWKDDKDDPAKMRNNIYTYTKNTIQQFLDEVPGINIGMVQIGNEITNGVFGEIANRDNGGRYTAVWGNEKTSKKVNSYLNAGAKAVRDTVPETLIVLQLETPNIKKYTDIMNTWKRDNVDYDVLGSSFYPFWTQDWTVEGVPNANTISNLEKIQELAASYGKLFVVAETAWVNNVNDSDGTHNAIGEADNTSAYEVGPQGQVDQLSDMYECLTKHANTLGAFYWEPAWIAVKPGWVNWEYNNNMSNKYGTGWAAEAAESYCAYDKIHDSEGNGTWGGSSWDNCALFDYNGYALQSLRFYKESVSKEEEQIVVIHFVDENGNDISKCDFVKIEIGKEMIYHLPKINGYTYADRDEITLTGEESGIKYINITYQKDDSQNGSLQPAPNNQTNLSQSVVNSKTTGVIIKEKKFNKVVSIKKKKFSIYKNLNLQKKNIKNYKKKYVAKKVYKHKNGHKYLKLFTKKGKFVGYIDKKAVKILRTTQGKKYKYAGKVRVIKKQSKIYANFNWKIKKINVYNKNYNAKYYYKHINGKTYLALYKKGRFIGYINKKAVSLR